MKKSLIILMVLLFSTQLSAVNLSSSGTGEVLIFPYYTVNNDINSLINLVNTTNQAKALRVRFREAANSREVFAFNLYLGAHDVWTGALIKSDEADNNFTKIISADKSCSIPEISLDGRLFTNSKYTGENSDAYGAETNRMHEGFLEVIEMGVLTGDSAAATVINNGTANCNVLKDAWDSNSGNAYWLADASTDMQAPSGGILGNVVLIDVKGGIAVSEDATALNDFSDDILNFAIDNDSPNLSDGKTTAQIETEGQVVTVNWDTGFEAVSSVLMKTSISNEYVLDDVIGANTEWILTLPTRQFHTDMEITSSNTPLPPFTFINSSGIACETFAVTGLYDREEQVPSEPSGTINPPTPPPSAPIRFPALCFTTNVNQIFRNTDIIGDSTVFGGHFTTKGILENDLYDISLYGLVPGFSEGWINLSFNGKVLTDQANKLSIDNVVDIYGLPVIGFSVQRYVNANLSGGVLANYAGLFNHKYQQSIELADGTETQSGLHLSKDNRGQVLLFPYYTVRNDLNTLISVVNTTDDVKALKVRFNEGKNGREALDFNLYLSPYDVWTAALVEETSTVQGHEGEKSVVLLTNDTSCTVPAINGQEFLPFTFTDAFDDGQGTNLERVQEGFLEVIEMGIVIGADAVSATHTVAGVPASCAQINVHWTPGVGQWAIDPTVNMIAPDGAGGLYGSISLIDVGGGVDMTYDATAIVGYSTENQHTEPGSLSPNLSTGSQNNSLIETDSGLMQVTWDAPLDAVSSLFMQAQVSNDFVIEAGIGAQTEWVNTFPTKAFYVDPIYSNSTLPLPPFKTGLSDAEGACEYHRFKAFDREQNLNTATDVVIVDTPPPEFSLFPEDCWTTVVSDVNNGSDENTIFDSNLKLIDWFADSQYTSVNDLPFTTGWMQVDFVDEVLNPGKITGTNLDGQTVEIFGKPVLGFVAQKYVNGTLDGDVLANYAVVNKNKSRKNIVIMSTNKK